MKVNLNIALPAFVFWPEVLNPAALTAPVHVVDWMSTICALLDIPEAKDARRDGMNISPLLLGENKPPLVNRELYWQGVHHKSAALRKGNCKLVIHRHNEKDKLELFDLSTDPYEKNNLSEKEPSLVSKMLKALVIQKKKDNDALPND